ncbi:MAG: Uma2 family endonuclease, partial [Bacteroidota bacterium]|nr:Uma2 family endonuclease [Bacteroidota bacterium]
MQTVFPDTILPLYGLNYDTLSDDEFFDLCAKNETARIERDSNRQIYIMAPTGSSTGITNIKIATQLTVWNEKKNNGQAFDSSTGFTLPDDSVFSPDASWMRNEKWDAIPKKDK